MHFSITNLLSILREFEENETLYGVPVNPYDKGYSEAKARKAKFKLGAAMDKHRNHSCTFYLGLHNANEIILGAKAIADHTYETFNEPCWRDIKTLIGDYGLIERNFDSLTKEEFQRARRYVSLSPVLDNAERSCLHLVQKAEWMFGKFVNRVSFGPEERLGLDGVIEGLTFVGHLEERAAD
jgi:hypothetical protein